VTAGGQSDAAFQPEVQEPNPVAVAATDFSARLKTAAQDRSNAQQRLARHGRSGAVHEGAVQIGSQQRPKHRIAPELGIVRADAGKRRGGPTTPRLRPSGPGSPVAGKLEAIMNMQFLRRGITARPARHLKAQSSLVRRLVQAQDDPGKQRIRTWLRALDDEQLSNLGLNPEDIHALRS